VTYRVSFSLVSGTYCDGFLVIGFFVMRICQSVVYC
jgi:hypothetical protein